MARQTSRQLSPVGYFHVVFTLPGPITDIAYQNKTVIYDLFFKAAAETTLTIAADLEHLGARIGITTVYFTLGFGAHSPSASAYHRTRQQHYTRQDSTRCRAGQVSSSPGASTLTAVSPAFSQDARRRAQGRPPRLLRRPRSRAPSTKSISPPFLAPLRRAESVVYAQRPFSRPGRCSLVSPSTPTASPSLTAAWSACGPNASVAW